MQHREGLLNEYQKNIVVSKKLMNRAYENSCDEEERIFLKKELDRVKAKLNVPKKKKSKKKSYSQ